MDADRAAVVDGLPDEYIDEALKFPNEWERLAKLRDGINQHLYRQLARIKATLPEQT